jgi:hypothetical protein
MPGLNPNGLASGFRQGFGMMSDYQAQQQQMDLQRRQEARAQQAFETQQELRELKIDETRDKMARERAKQGLQQLAVGQPPGEESLAAMNDLGIEPRKLVSGDYLEAANTLQQGLGAQSMDQGPNLQGPSQQDAMLQGQTQGMQLGRQATEGALQSPQAQKRTAEALNDPNIIEAANTFLEGRLQRGVGEKKDLPEEAGGGQGTILRKRINRLVPMQGGTVGMDLEVMARNEDGEVVTYNAPVTENRSGSPDDPVQGVPVDELMSHAAGLTQEAKAFQMDPQARENARQVLYQMDPDMAPERKIVDLGPAGKAMYTQGQGMEGLQPIPGTAEGEGEDVSSSGQKFQELVRLGYPKDQARRIAYGELDSEGGGGSNYEYSQFFDDLYKVSGSEWGEDLGGGGFSFPSADAQQIRSQELAVGDWAFNKYGNRVTPGMVHETFRQVAQDRVTPEGAQQQAMTDVEQGLADVSLGGWTGDYGAGDTFTVNIGGQQREVTWQEGESVKELRSRLVDERASQLIQSQPDVGRQAMRRLRQRMEGGQEAWGEQEAQAAEGPTSQGGIPTVTTTAEWNQLDPGQQYRDPNGQIRTKRSQ